MFRHYPPSGVLPVGDLAKLRGAMWTARAPVDYGPRRRQPDNCICIDYFEHFSPEDRALIKSVYVDQHRYKNAPMGPLVDPGYHGQLPASDWRGDPSPYWDAAEELQNAMRQHDPSAAVIHFLRPDRGVAGLEWTVDDLDRELGSTFRSVRAQELINVCCIGWEPGPRYYYRNAWWVEMAKWQARTFPNALRLIHMVADCDAPAGGSDDVDGDHDEHGNPIPLTNGKAWANVAPYLHGFLAQYGGYVGDGTYPPDPNNPNSGQSVDVFIPNIKNAIHDMADRFKTGRGGWPTSSAFGSGKPMLVYGGEYAAFRDYWGNAPESESIRIGDACIAAGGAGYFDGGSVAI